MKGSPTASAIPVKVTGWNVTGLLTHDMRCGNCLHVCEWPEGVNTVCLNVDSAWYHRGKYEDNPDLKPAYITVSKGFYCTKWTK